ncbi:MAG: NAD(P)-dependent oxidoreductase [Chitinophagaceae bacterium]
MNNKVLITGASGFVGFHLIEAALEKGLEVYAAVRKSSNVQHLQGYNIQYTYPDLTSIESLKKDIEEKQYSFIIHAAGATKAKRQEDYNEINAQYTYNIIKAAEQSGVAIQKIVMMSSLAAIGPLSNIKDAITETTIAAPVTQYGKSKLLAEERLSTSPLPWIVLRPTAVYGPRERDIFMLFKSIGRGMEPYMGKISQQLSFIYVKDLAAITVSALFSPVAHAIYNITDGRGYDRYELATIIKKELNRKTLRIHIPMPVIRALAVTMEKTYGWLGKTPVLNREKLHELTAANWYCDINKIKQELGFKPRYHLENGLKETIEWYKQHQWL